MSQSSRSSFDLDVPLLDILTPTSYKALSSEPIDTQLSIFKQVWAVACKNLPVNNIIRSTLISLHSKKKEQQLWSWKIWNRIWKHSNFGKKWKINSLLSPGGHEDLISSGDLLTFGPIHTLLIGTHRHKKPVREKTFTILIGKPGRLITCSSL